MDFKQLLIEIKNKTFRPIYLLHGEEPFFIDQLTHAIEMYCLEDFEKDFNQTILYGKEAEPLSLTSELKGFPMMGEKKLVILKEAQEFSKLEQLEPYVENPNPSTIFVINYKYKTFDSRKKFFKACSKNGVVFKSDKVRDYQLNSWINGQVKEHGFGITPKAEQLLADHLGNDLGRISSELEKLKLLIEKGTTISDVHIEENIGISKDYNTFEFSNALTNLNAEKAFKIVTYFSHNPKAWNMIELISLLFKSYSQLMRVHFLPSKSKEAVASALKIHPFFAQELLLAAKKINPKKVASNIGILYEFDQKSKGVGSTGNITAPELLKEMTFRLLY